MNKRIKTLCMYLPQFHKVAENEEWWGEGFTEWTAVRGAESLFEGHKQPIKPLNENYYDLLEKGIVEWQSELMKKYGIDGQCFYHYYFKDGRRILEKPAENLLQWEDIDMPFCFCWANGSWTRTWSNLKGNSWASKFENKNNIKDDGLLIEQRYGREDEWKAHFDYLLPFFRDERYIRVNDSPIFLIYSPRAIPCLPQMVDYWNELAVEQNIPGIYFIGMNSKKHICGMNAMILHAPHMAWRLDNPIGGIHRIDYDDMWKNIREAKPIDGCRTYYCGVPNVDNTPRMGRYGGVLFKNFTIDKFYKGMCDIYKKSIEEGNEFVFVNSWNEWGEGMQIEPDEEYGYAKLEAIHKAQEMILREAAVSDKPGDENKDKRYVEMATTGANYLTTAKSFDMWMGLREKNISIVDYLERYHVKNVAVYGYGMLAKHLIPELEETNIAVEYIIDKGNQVSSKKYNIKNLEDDWQPVDAIIVTIVDEFESIYKILKKRMNCRIFSLYEIVSELP